ncbi:MAG: Xaa-Pro peptidase family protein [Phycisphaerales bacterium]|jgi:Xaa-Pro aminopeptidase|nr:Xaa-Pro peptidase family protein [Phycisphaerales bacterium]
MSQRTSIMAGIPASNMSLYHAIRFMVGDPCVVIDQPGTGRTLIIRDIEMDRARKHARADRVLCPADCAPASGLSGDRETATAQSAAEFLRREGVMSVVADRTLPLIFADTMQRAGVTVACDPEMGVRERRAKDEEEIASLREAQRVTEGVMRRACETIARATPDENGVLMHAGEWLESERLKSMIEVWLLELGYRSPGAIVASGAHGGDCHHRGSGAIRTGELVIVDIFPQNIETRYWGDCTRTVVHGAPSPEAARMHKAVLDAKHSGERACRAGVTGEDVYRAAIAEIERHGFQRGLPGRGFPEDATLMQHGLGHGIGLDCHEPPLADVGGPELIAGDCLTIEPGLYSIVHGGVRIEDSVVVRANGCENLGAGLHEGLAWA